MSGGDILWVKMNPIVLHQFRTQNCLKSTIELYDGKAKYSIKVISILNSFENNNKYDNFWKSMCK
jgi:hypothetical protein